MRRPILLAVSVLALACLGFYAFTSRTATESTPIRVDYELKEVIKSADQNFKVETVVDDLRIPWGLDFLPNGNMLITERGGKFYLRNKSGNLQEISGVPEVKSRGQGGLLDVAIHPNFKDNKWIYLSYSKPNPDGGNTATTAIARGKLNGTKLEQVKEIFVAGPYFSTNHHYGSRIEFDNDGYLFFSVGDRGKRDQNPQSLDNDCGKIHRIHDDGRIPEDNPFVGQRGAKKSIYSYGHRNPQGLSRAPSGAIWSHEHGPRGGDEVNHIRAGKNFGWPVISYGINYSGTKFTKITKKEGMEQPELYWVPSIAPCGMDFIEGGKFSGWEGDLFVGSLKFDYINRCKMKDGKIVGEEKLVEDIGRVRDIQMGLDGFIYVALEDPGKVVRLVPE